jgi:serine/threonine-protein kinase HipA
MPPKRLGVWLEGVHVANFEQPRWPAIRCLYTDEALERWPRNSPLPSCSLPLDSRPLDALSFCAGLLPEGQALATMAANARLPVDATFDLLRRYGRDVAGALVIAESEPVEREFGVEPSTEALAIAVGELDEFPLGATTTPSFRSLACRTSCSWFASSRPSWSSSVRRSA